MHFPLTFIQWLPHLGGLNRCESAYAVKGEETGFLSTIIQRHRGFCLGCAGNTGNYINEARPAVSS